MNCRQFSCLLLCGAGLVAARAQQPLALSSPSDFDSDVPAMGFTIIPKAFQRNPTLQMTVFTTVTNYGKGFTPATREVPQYYQLSDQGRQERGTIIAGDAGPSRDDLLPVLQRSLSATGLKPAGEGHPANVALVWYWGSHNGFDGEAMRLFPDRARQDIVERAVLVGGRPYAARFVREFMYGGIDNSVSGKNEYLRAQTVEDLYFVVVSAYAMSDLARGEPRLLWRTTMTVNTIGVSMRESLPPLIFTAGDYFGRATTEPVALRRTIRRGTIRLGPMQILESGVLAWMPVPRK